MDNTEPIVRLLARLLESESDPGESQRCPICQGELHVRFEAYQRGRERLLGATAECRTCGAAAAMDYAGPPPTWVK